MTVVGETLAGAVTVVMALGVVVGPMAMLLLPVPWNVIGLPMLLMGLVVVWFIGASDHGEEPS